MAAFGKHDMTFDTGEVVGRGFFNENFGQPAFPESQLPTNFNNRTGPITYQMKDAPYDVRTYTPGTSTSGLGTDKVRVVASELTETSNVTLVFKSTGDPPQPYVLTSFPNLTHLLNP